MTNTDGQTWVLDTTKNLVEVHRTGCQAIRANPRKGRVAVSGQTLVDEIADGFADRFPEPEYRKVCRCAK